MDEKSRKSITKELDVCHDCAEYGGHFCDECLEEIKNMKAVEASRNAASAFTVFKDDPLLYTQGTRMDDAYYYFKPEDTTDGKKD
jgi:hypothetical protein